MYDTNGINAYAWLVNKKEIINEQCHCFIVNSTDGYNSNKWEGRATRKTIALTANE